MLDFKNFQKVSEDKDSVTMKHKDGHEIRVAMKALPKLQQDQIRSLKLCKGGSVKRKKYADGELVVKDQNQAPDDSVQNPYANQEGMQSSSDAPLSNIDPNRPQDMPGANLANDPDSSQPDAIDLSKVKELKNTDDAGNVIPGNLLKNVNTAGDLGRDIDTNKAKQQENTEAAYIADRQREQQIEQQKYIDMKKHTDDFAAYNRLHPIDPKHYQESIGAGSKVTNAIGLLLGGFKQGVVGGNNPAMDFINQQIDRDIAGQKARADQQKTVWGAYKDLYGIGAQADAATKASLLDIYSHRVLLDAAKIGTPTAMRNAMLFKADATMKAQQALKEGAVPISAITFGAGSGVGSGSGGSKTSPTDAAYTAAGVDPKAPDRDAQLKSQGRDPEQYVSNYQKAHAGDSSNSDISQPKDYTNFVIPQKEFNARIARLQYDPTKKDIIPQIRQDYANAQNLQKSMAELDEILPKLKGKATLSGLLADDVSPHTLGALGAGAGAAIGGLSGATSGGGIGETIGQLAHAGANYSGGQDQRQYAAMKGDLQKVLSTALSGANISPTGIEEYVNTHAPKYGDSDETVKMKIDLIKKFLFNKLDRTNLEQAGMMRMH